MYTVTMRPNTADTTLYEYLESKSISESWDCQTINPGTSDAHLWISVAFPAESDATYFKLRYAR